MAKTVTTGLRELADFLDAHPDIPLPCSPNLLARVNKRDEVAAIARTGEWAKVYQGDYFSLTKTFSGGVKLDIYTDRSEVCRKVVTGTRVVPAQAATEERIEEITEWVCDGSLLQEKAVWGEKVGA